MYTDFSILHDRGWATPGGASSSVIDPATGEEIARLPHSSASDIERLIAEAQSGFQVWSKTSSFDRSRILRDAAERIRKNADHIAGVLTLEQGKIIAEARGEVLAAADTLDWCAEEGRRSYGRIVPSRMGGMRHYVMKEPVGVVAAFTPWNFPAISPMRKMAAALGAGCSIIIKPAEETPGTAIEMARCLFEAGLPAGALSLVFGVPSEVSQQLLASPAVKKISFTGSTAVGKHLLRLAADTVKRTTMELGGHSPVIVFEDADIDAAAQLAAAGKYRNAGQVCISPTRFYVQESQHKRFLNAFADVARNLKVGAGSDPATQMGPLANRRRLEAVEAIVADATSKGATVVTGGKRVGNKGFFYAPTVLDRLSDDAMILAQEPFGPVAPILPFRTFDEVVTRANALPYGLAAYVFTKSDEIAERAAQSIESGMVGINNLTISLPELPFGGIKESGHGSEGGIEGLDVYMNTKLVSRS